MSTQIQDTMASLAPLTTPAEALAALRGSRRTLGRMLADGRLHAVRIGGLVRIPRVEIARYLGELGSS